MALPRTPLDPGSLADGVKKVLGAAAPAKMMAARGLAPLKPTELAVVLYMLSLEADEPLKNAAAKTAGELPEKVLAGALADATLDPRVLDFFAPKIVAKLALVESLLLNRATADETIAEITGKLGEREIEIVATNDERLLRCPAIIGAMYMNPRARMSTVDRAVELAVRNNITVPGIAAWSDIVQAVMGTKRPQTLDEKAAEDAAFKAVADKVIGEHAIHKGEMVEVKDDDDLEQVTAQEEKIVEEAKAAVPIEKLSIPSKIRLATLGNAFARAILIRDSNKQVSLAAIRSPGVTDNEAVKFSANRALSDDVVRVIANTKEWTKLYQVKVNLLNNPKCPLPVAMRFLPFLQPKDLRNMSRSKSVPSALVAQAKKLLATKTH